LPQIGGAPFGAAPICGLLPPMKPSVFRPLRILIFVFLTMLVLGLVGSALLTFREGRRLSEAEDAFDQMREFHRVHLIVTQRLVHLGQGADEERGEIAKQLDQLKTLALDPETPDKLGEVGRSVQQPAGREVVLQQIVTFEQIAVRERSSEARLLDQLQRDTLAQLQMEIAIPLALLAAALILYPVARSRILKPLEAFGRELTRVGEGDLRPAPSDEVDPLLLPLHRGFNELVARLRQLEDAHERRAGLLETEVRTATRALMEQQRSLARAERLAATGELAATVAHELRNPLAGIQMTLHNLRAEIDDAELTQRIDRVVHEVERLGRLLNQILDAARHVPEPPREVNLAALVDDLLNLTRHQLPPGIRLESRIESGLVCHLPQDTLRQTLLNLVLNAANALGEEGTITVVAAKDGENIRLEVEDDGPGFPPELLASGIRPFFSTREQGTGLGLAFTRRFARDLGGEVLLANREPRGARVTLSLPATAEHA
jgi:two-component system, NtrC family, sensor kinase